MDSKAEKEAIREALRESLKNDPEFNKVVEEHDNLFGLDPSKEEKVTLRGKILNARYFPDEGYIAIQLVMQDGSKRATYLHKSSVVYRGKKLPPEELEKEMMRTAEMFRQARGRTIKVEMFEKQAQL